MLVRINGVERNGNVDSKCNDYTSRGFDMGFDFGKFLKIAEIVAPAALMAAGVPAPLVPLVVHGIQLAESKPASGAEKKALVLDSVSTYVAAHNLIKPGAVDPDVVGVVSEGIDVAVGAINAVQTKGKGPIK